MPLFVPEVQPGEVENLMDEDSGQAPGGAEQLFVEDDLPAAQEGCRMNRRPPVRAGEELSAIRCQGLPEGDSDAVSRKFRKQCGDCDAGRAGEFE